MATRKRPARAAAAHAATAMALAAVPDRPAAKRAKAVKKRYPKAGERVFVWDIQWHISKFEEGTVASVAKNRWMFVHFDDGSKFEIKFRTSNQTYWTQDKAEKVPESCLQAAAALAIKTGKKKSYRDAAKDPSPTKSSNKSTASKPKASRGLKVGVVCTQCLRCCACWERAVPPSRKYHK